MNRRLLIGFVAMSLTSSALPQTCPTEPYDLIMPPALNSGDDYGAALAVAGEWLFVGAPLDDQLETDAGAVYVFQLDGGIYEFRQKLLASGGVGPAQFGFSLASHNGVLVIGAPKDQQINQINPNAFGAAHVFRLIDEKWSEEQKLMPFGDGAAQNHGHSVSVDTETCVVGATVLVSQLNEKGAAYVYRHAGTFWENEQRLDSPSADSPDWFGAALALSDGMVLIGAPQNDDLATDAGAVFVFERTSATWSHVQTLYAADAQASALFGSSIAQLGTAAVVGEPNKLPSGAVHQYQLYDRHWNGGSVLVPNMQTSAARFGAALTLTNERLVIGSPHFSNGPNPPNQNVGMLHSYTKVRDQWIFDRMILQVQPSNLYGYAPFQCLLTSPQPSGWPQSPNNAQMGRSVAIGPAGILTGSNLVRPMCWGFVGPQDSGSLAIFADQFESLDCNNDGLVDLCDPTTDCNGNGVPDACDLSATPDVDCNQNKVPDECEIVSRYSLDKEGGIPLLWHTGSADFIWLNQYRVKPGGQYVSHIELQSSGYLPPDAPVILMVYADPTNDGDASDAALIAKTMTTQLSWNFVEPQTQQVVISIEPVYVGEPGTFFFIGAALHNFGAAPHVWALAATGWNPLLYNRSWLAISPAQTADIYDLMNNSVPIHLWTSNGPRAFILRGIASDCNGNGAWDACEIANGEVPDVNGNGIPDSCEVPNCFFADLIPAGGDGEVNVLDLLHVITNWGVCNPCYAICPGDTNDDCATDVIDLLAVINGWGPCK